MNIVDSCGWLEYFADTVNADNFAPIIEDTNNLIVPTVIIFEVYKVLYKRTSESVALSAVAHMQNVKVVDLTSDIALLASILSIEEKIPFADSIILATSRIYDAKLYTQDNHFEQFDDVFYFKKM